MAQDNCAQEAPQGRLAHAPTGFRRMTPGLLKADRTAEGFAGLPEGVTVAGPAARRLQGGGAAARHLAAPGARGRLAVPLHPAAGLGSRGAGRSCGPRRSMQQEALGLSPTQAKAINRRLIELGLVTMKDSPNGKRYGKRDPKTGRHHRSLRLRSVADRRRAMPNSAAWRRRAGRSAPLWAGCAGGRRSRARPSRRSSRRPPNTRFEGEEWQTLARESDGPSARAEGRRAGRRDGDSGSPASNAGKPRPASVWRAC